MFCNRCGNKLTEGATFCEHCGASINSQQAAPPDLFEQTQQASPPDAYTQYLYKEPQHEKPKAISSTFILLLVAVFVICIGIGIGGAFLITDNSVDNEETPNMENASLTDEAEVEVTPEPAQEPESPPIPTPAPTPPPAHAPEPATPPEPEPAATPEPTPEQSSEPLHKQLMNAVLNTNDAIEVTINWTSGDHVGSTTVFERAVGSSVWMMRSRDGEYREVEPDFADEGNAFTIGFPTTRRRYFLLEDGTGRFAHRDGSVNESLKWEFTQG